MKRAHVDQALHLLNEPRPVSKYVVMDPSALQAHVDEITGAPPIVRARRGTSNTNVRGGSPERRRRREWLVQCYRANRDVVVIEMRSGPPLIMDVNPGTEGSQMACRCYRCGLLLTVDTVTVDRITPGCQGGTYRRDNIRPACGPCNSETGGSTRGKR